MAISRKERQVPRELPPARLYLEDLQMIIRIFQEAAESKTDAQPELQFEIDDHLCTELSELSKIAATTHNFSMNLEMPNFKASLYIFPTFTRWYSFGLEDKEDWSLYSKLEPIFKGRERTSVALARKVPPEFLWLAMGVVGTLLLFPWLVHYSMMPFIISPVPSARVPALFAAGVIVLWMVHDKLNSSHSIVVLSHYSESSADRDKSFRGKVWDVAKIVLAAVVGALIYKFWPKP